MNYAEANTLFEQMFSETEEARFSGLLAMRLTGLGQQMKRAVEEIIQSESKFTSGQWWAFDAVCRAHPEGLHVRDITEKSYVSIDGARRIDEIIKRKDQLVLRKVDMEDRRYKKITATELGLRHHQALLERLRRQVARKMSDLTDAEVEILYRALKKLT